ncbi:NACHT, LRR and PYD domains-containing protein 1 homolog isoform X2 [Misgurnus anguillicaudatus]|uniref:NACHT, LRR and PYD domains-containing protein 1 homolog isoform X2 n=1 Tax=Misgurnus anguillicaudatus TaxID=75329 RepID=UPI003CCF42E6
MAVFRHLIFCEAGIENKKRDEFEGEMSRAHNVSVVAQNGSHITAPVLTSNTITGNVYITHNASGTSHQDFVETQPSANPVICKYKKDICSVYQCFKEYNSLPGENVLLCERYTEPLIIQKHRDQKEREEEISSKGESFQQVFSSRSSHESVLNSLFHTDDHGITPRAVILQGNSGNGKSFVVQKIMMDWASGNLYKDQFDVVFHLKCKEIKCISGKRSLLELLSRSCGLTSDEISQMLQWSSERLLFIIDGFDELRLPQDDNNVTSPTNPNNRCKPVHTLCALLKGHLQMNSFLLVTSRSTATDNLSNRLKNPQRFTEIMGFSERGVEEYFQKFFQDEGLFEKAYKFVKSNETLFTACSIPVICWIICTTLKERFKPGVEVISGLETTTSIYVDFVFTLLDHHSQGLNQLDLLRSLGQLAERGMHKERVLFDKKTFDEIMKDQDGSPFLCKYLFKRRIQQKTMFSFMHLSFQEFFIALYCVCLNTDRDMRKLNEALPLRDVGKFAFGLLNKELQCTLEKHGLIVSKDTEAHLKKHLEKIKGLDGSPQYFLNCLYEVHEKSFVQEAMTSWNKIFVYGGFFSRTDCWALQYCGQFCQSFEEIKITYCNLTPEKLSMILPVLHKCKRIVLDLLEPTDSVLADLMCSITGGQGQCVNAALRMDFPSVDSISLLVSNEESRSEVHSLCLTLPRSEPIDWAKFFQVFTNGNLDALMSAIQSQSELKKVELKVDCLNESLSLSTLSTSQKCTSLTEIKIEASFLLEEGIKILQKPHTRSNCTLTFEGLRCTRQSEKCALREHKLSCNQMFRICVTCQGSDEVTYEESWQRGVESGQPPLQQQSSSVAVERQHHTEGQSDPLREGDGQLQHGLAEPLELQSELIPFELEGE